MSRFRLHGYKPLGSATTITLGQQQQQLVSSHTKVDQWLLTQQFKQANKEEAEELEAAIDLRAALSNTQQQLHQQLPQPVLTIPKLPAIVEGVLASNALNISSIVPTLAAAAIQTHTQMTTDIQQQHQEQLHPYPPHQPHHLRHQSQEHQQQHQQFFNQSVEPGVRSMFKMDADFWQQARNPFGLHAAAALASNQIHQQHHLQQHQQTQQHLSQQHPAQQQHLIQQPEQQHSNSQQQQEQSHHLLFNAAAAAAAAAHLSGVVKSNEIQQSCSTNNASNTGDLNSATTNSATNGERTALIAKQEPEVAGAARSGRQQQLKYEQGVPSPPGVAIDALQQQLQHQLQQQLQQQQEQRNSNNNNAGSGSNDNFNAGNKQQDLKPQLGSSTLNNDTQVHAAQHQQQQHHHHQQQQQHYQQHHHQQQQLAVAAAVAAAAAVSETGGQPPSQQHQQQHTHHQVQTPHKLLAAPGSPLQMTAQTHAHSPQQSLTPSGGSSTPDLKFSSEKLANEIQLQLSRSNSAAAISERTLEECWSTLQRLFMHKSAMQQIQQIPRVGLGPGAGPGSMGSSETKPHQCQQCMKSFSSNHQLVQHIRVHTGEKPYKCSYCDRRFKQLSHVQQHTRLHTGERPYKCHLPDCGRAFIQLSNLQQHLRNHDAQVERAKNRPFHCNICGKGFATESSLRTHTSKELQLHLGVLQQHAALIGGPNATSCPVCHKLFLGTDALMEHMKHAHKDKTSQPVASPFIDNIGSGCLQTSSSSSNDPYLAKRRSANHPCPVCGKHYVNEGSLRKHLACHPETSQLTNSLRMWPCSVCQAVFTHENGLLTHMEHMRMDPKHQFAAQYVLSRAAAERRERDSILAATLAASASGCGGVGVGGMLPLVGSDNGGGGGGSNSMCPSPSANSECSSNGRLSSSAASDQGSGINLLNNNENINNNNNNNSSNNNNNSINNNNANNNNNCSSTNNNKLNDILRSNASNAHIPAQYGSVSETDMHVANRMSLMAAASAAAAAVAAQAGGASGGNVGGVSAPSPGCVGVDTTANVVSGPNAAVQAAVVNLAAAMRINQQVSEGSANNSTTNTANNSILGSDQQQSSHHASQQQQQPSSNSQQQGNMPSGRRSSPLNVADASAANAVAAMNAMRDTMMRTGMGVGVVDQLSGIQHQQVDSHTHQHLSSSSLPTNNAYSQHSVVPPPPPQHPAQHQNPLHTHPHTHAHHHHHHNHHHSQMQQGPHSPETALRMQQQAEAILRSHTEAAFRLAATVAASNGVGSNPNNANTGSGNNNNNNNSNVITKIEPHQQHQHIASDVTMQPQQHQQQHPPTTNGQQQKIGAQSAAQQQATQPQTQLSPDLSEAIRLQEHRLEQALRLHNDARALNFLSAAQAVVGSNAHQQQHQHPHTHQHQTQQQQQHTHHNS